MPFYLHFPFKIACSSFYTIKKPRALTEPLSSKIALSPLDTVIFLLYSGNNNFRNGDEFLTRLFSSWLVALVALFGISFLMPTMSTLLELILQNGIMLVVAFLINQFVLKQRIGLEFKSGLGNAIVLNIPTWFILTSAVTLALDAQNQSRLGLAFTAALGASLFEEYLFRGVLLPFAIRTMGGRHAIFWGVVTSSLMFGVSHMLNFQHQNLEVTLIQGASTFLIGLFIAALYLRTHNLLWPILFHFTNDFGSILASGKIVSVAYVEPTRLIGTLILFGGLAAFYLRRDRQVGIKQRFGF
jgi:membrane protease YdiL (CAAX protease family)